MLASFVCLISFEREQILLSQWNGSISQLHCRVEWQIMKAMTPYYAWVMKPKGTQYFLQLRKYEIFAMAPIQFFFELEHLSRIFALESQTMCIIKFTILKKHCHNVMFYCICKYIFTEKYKNSGQVYNSGPSYHRFSFEKLIVSPKVCTKVQKFRQ